MAQVEKGVIKNGSCHQIVKNLHQEFWACTTNNPERRMVTVSCKHLL